MRISDWSSDVCSSDLHHSADTETPQASVPAPKPPRRTARFRSAGETRAWTVRVETGFGSSAWRTSRQKNCIYVQYRPVGRSEEHTSELQSLMRISYAVFCLKKKKKTNNESKNDTQN